MLYNDGPIYSNLTSKQYCVTCYGFGDQTLCDSDPNCEYNQPRYFGPYSTQQEAENVLSSCPAPVGIGAC
jgi:hypothetical protein